MVLRSIHAICKYEVTTFQIPIRPTTRNTKKKNPVVNSSSMIGTIAINLSFFLQSYELDLDLKFRGMVDLYYVYVMIFSQFFCNFCYLFLRDSKLKLLV